MKRYISHIFAVFFLLAVNFAAQVAIAQRSGLPDNLTGMNLKEAERILSRSIKQGNDSLKPDYAHILFYTGELQKSLALYRKADSLGLPMTPRQKANYQQIALLMGHPSPFADRMEDYFKEVANKQVSADPFCGNSGEGNIASFVWQDKVFVTSSRARTRREARNHDLFTQRPFLNIFSYTHDCDPADIDYLPPGLNTRLHDGPLAISADTTLVVITRNYRERNEEGIQTLYLAYYTKEGDEWSDMQVFPFGDAQFNVKHPFIDNKNGYLYYASDKPGGYGGYDIYRSQWDGDQWSDPENMGSEINTSYDEVFPVIAPDGTFYYSTNHIETQGGLGVVMFRDGERFLMPEAMNSVYDDFAIQFLTDSSGYFTSNRGDVPFGDKLYYFEILPHFPFIVKVVDEITNEPIEDVKVEFTVAEPLLSGIGYTSEEGEVTIYEGHEEKLEVDLVLSKEGYQTAEVTSDEFVFEDNRWVLNAPLFHPHGYFEVFFDNHWPDPNSHLPTTSLTYEETFEQYMGRMQEYKNVMASPQEKLEEFFTRVEDGMANLRRLAAFLQKELSEGRTYTIVFTSHASPLGTDEYNMQLSKRRFSSVENYLKAWDNGALREFIELGMLDYANEPFGSSRVPAGIPGDEDVERAIYSVEAAEWRKVTISWRRFVMEP